jgi:hypothetical protein
MTDSSFSTVACNSILSAINARRHARRKTEEIEDRMDALAREYAETHDPEIINEILELSRRLRELGNILLEAGKNKLH